MNFQRQRECRFVSKLLLDTPKRPANEPENLSIFLACFFRCYDFYSSQ